MASGNGSSASSASWRDWSAVTMSERLWWAYGVVRDSIPGLIAAPGIEGCPVEVLRHGGLALLVSPVPREGYSTEALQERLNDLDTLAALARTHEAVLEAALAEGDVVPFRICTVYATRDAALEMLVAEAG